MKKIIQLYDKLANLSDKGLSPFVDLAIRLYMANIFFKSGWLRLQDYLNGTWDNQIVAFTEYHPIPGVPGEVAAIFGTGGEVILPILIATGFLTRIGAGGLLFMTLSIQFLVPAEYGVMNDDHYLWILLLAVPMLRGGGTLSIDFVLRRFLFKKTS